MSRIISFRDLQVIPGLSQYNEVELLHPSMDDKVNFYLEQLGFNTNAPVEYIPNKHRDMQGNVGVGFRAVGTIDTTSEFLKTNLATMEDRIMATFFRDPSLARELAHMLQAGIRFTVQEVEEDSNEDEFPEELIEPDHEEVSAEIKAMESLRDAIRGPMYNDSGAAKTTKEYKEFWISQQ